MTEDMGRCKENLDIRQSSIPMYIDQLNKLLKMDEKDIPDNMFGICSNLSDPFASLFGYNIVSHLCSNWEHFSGSKNWPIKEEDEYSLGNHWIGEGRVLRNSLMEHLILELQSMIIVE